MTTRDEQLVDAVRPLLDDLGLELFDLDRQGGKLVVTVDRPGGVDLDAIAAATRAVSHLLDELDPIAGRYVLEVSSPGLERPLRTPAHFAWARGRQVTVRRTGGGEGERRVTGLLLAADDEGITVRPGSAAGTDGDDLRLTYDEIDRARTVVDWDAELAGKGTRPAPEPADPGASSGPMTDAANDASSAAGGAATAGADPDQR